MSRKGAPCDTTVMESFFKQELTHHERFIDREEARGRLFDYIGLFYNRQRLHSSTNYRSPEKFGKIAMLPD